MTAEEHAKRFIGDLVFTIARLQAELDARPPAPVVSPPVPVSNDEAGSVQSSEEGK